MPHIQRTTSYSSKTSPWAFIGLCLLCALCGCSLVRSGESLVWDEVASTESGWAAFESQDTPRLAVITTAEETGAIQASIMPSHIKQIMTTDFSAYTVVIVFQGRKPSTGYSVQIDEVRRDGTQIAVYAKFNNPPKGTPLGQIFTSPYCILRIEKQPNDAGNYVLVSNGTPIP